MTSFRRTAEDAKEAAPSAGRSQCRPAQYRSALASLSSHTAFPFQLPVRADELPDEW